MTTQYVMRAFKTTGPTGHVYWAVLGAPDNTGAQSGYNPADLTGITTAYTLSVPINGSGGISQAGLAGGDLSGTFPNPTVTHLQGAAVSSNSVTNDGYTLTSIGGSWIPKGVESVFNVKNFGADATGAMDSTSAINDAIFASSEAGGATVYFPPGTYKVTSTLTAPTNSSILYGASPGDNVSIPSSTITTALDIPIFAPTGMRDVHFKYLGFKCTAGGSNTSGCFMLTDSPYNVWSHCLITGFGYGVKFIKGLSSNSCFDNQFNHCIIVSNRLSNIEYVAGASANSNQFLHCQVGGNSLRGIVFRDSDTINIIGGGVENTTNEALIVDNTQGGRLQAAVNVVGWHLEYDSTTQTLINLGPTGHVDGVTIIGCVFYTSGSGGAEPILLTNATNVVRLGNTFQGGYTTAYLHKGIVSSDPVTYPNGVTTNSTSAYTIDSSFIDDIVAIDTGVNAQTVTMPAPSLGLRRRIIGITGSEPGRQITVIPHGSEKFFGVGSSISGVSSITIDVQWGHLDLCSLDGTNWWVLDGAFGTSEGDVYTGTFLTTANGQQAFLNVPFQVSGGQGKLRYSIVGVVTVAGASSAVGDTVCAEGVLCFKNISGTISQVSTVSAAPLTFGDASQTTGGGSSQLSNIGLQGISGTNVQIGVEQSGAPNVGASLRWTVRTVVVRN